MTLADIQTRVQSLIKADFVLGSLPVLLEDKETLANEVENVLATQAMCIVIAPAAGDACEAAWKSATADFNDELDVVIHRGLISDGAGLTTVDVLDRLLPLLHGVPASDNPPPRTGWPVFRCTKHRLVEQQDGTMSRVLTVAVQHRFSAPTS